MEKETMSSRTRRFEIWHKIDDFLPETFTYVDVVTIDEAWRAGRQLIAANYPGGRVTRVEEQKQCRKGRE